MRVKFSCQPTPLHLSREIENLDAQKTIML